MKWALFFIMTAPIVDWYRSVITAHTQRNIRKYFKLFVDALNHRPRLTNIADQTFTAQSSTHISSVVVYGDLEFYKVNLKNKKTNNNKKRNEHYLYISGLKAALAHHAPTHCGSKTHAGNCPSKHSHKISRKDYQHQISGLPQASGEPCTVWT